MPEGAGIGGLTAYGTLLSEYTYDWLNRAKVGAYYYAANARLPQYATEAVLRARAAEVAGIEVFYGWQGVALAQDDDGVTLGIAERTGEGRRELRADWLVGCDGAHSFVREAAGIGQTKSDHDRRMALVVFRSTELHELLKRYPGKAFYNVLHPDYEGYWLFFGRVDHGVELVLPRAGAAGCDGGDLRFPRAAASGGGAGFRARLRACGVLGPARGHRRTPTGRGGSSWRATRRIRTRPMAATGSTPGWRTRATSAGSSRRGSRAGAGRRSSTATTRSGGRSSPPPRGISSSGSSRRTARSSRRTGPSDADFAELWAARNLDAAEVQAFEPNYAGSPLVGGAGTPSARGSHTFAARAGHHLPPVDLGGGRMVQDALGDGFTLLALGSADPEPFRKAAEAAGVPLDVVEGDAAAAETCGAPLVLVRPDHFVAWTGAEGDAATILDRARGAGA